MKKHISITFIFAIMIIMLIANPAHAYVDPNTGGYVFQILFPILSGIAAIFLFFRDQAKRAIHGVVNLVRRVFGGKTDS